MSNNIVNIDSTGLALAFLATLPVLLLYIRWRLDIKNALLALVRMLLQLLAVGFFLVSLFSNVHPATTLAVLSLMMLAASWIALNSVQTWRKTLFFPAFFAIFSSGTVILVVITQGVLQVDPWYSPRYLIPLAGMVYASCMNAVSLAAERLHAELENKPDWQRARTIAYQAAMIPTINTLLAVGLVSLPGMMTGQILSGVSPLLAVKYQIVIMCMTFSTAGLSAAFFLALSQRKLFYEK